MLKTELGRIRDVSEMESFLRCHYFPVVFEYVLQFSSEWLFEFDGRPINDWLVSSCSNFSDIGGEICSVSSQPLCLFG